MAGMMDSAGARPRNLDYYLQRMSGYSKNTIRIQPQSKPSYMAGETVVFRLPTNSILDLHTLVLKFAGQLQNTAAGGGNIRVGWPRFTTSLIRRCDWTMGGMQVGLGSLHDYGFLSYWLQCHRVPIQRTQADLQLTDLGGYALTQPSSFTGDLGPSTSSGWQPFSISNWLGIASGSFMRFLVITHLENSTLQIHLYVIWLLCPLHGLHLKYCHKHRNICFCHSR